MIKKHPELQCNLCGYIPDNLDIQMTHYNLKTCDTCGQPNVCDLCIIYSLEEIKKIDKGEKGKSQCRKCAGYKPIGHMRKFYLEDEYK